MACALQLILEKVLDMFCCEEKRPYLCTRK